MSNDIHKRAKTTESVTSLESIVIPSPSQTAFCDRKMGDRRLGVIFFLLLFVHSTNDCDFVGSRWNEKAFTHLI